MIRNQLKPVFILTLPLACIWVLSLHYPPPATASPLAPPAVLGTWKGESLCVGNRPACKNEVVVYRFEAVPGQADVVVLLADKIIEGRRVPMGKLEFQNDEAKGELSCEFTRGQTRGLWQFKVTGERMEGTLMLLPDKEVVRRVGVKKVRAEEVPTAPARESYEGV
ncbi:MAG TPA: hypothetical protein VKA60_03465 [Blastocatellia bacterium]|nr:hypothetical protein [Blastocatellia bacterium]